MKCDIPVFPSLTCTDAAPTGTRSGTIRRVMRAHGDVYATYALQTPEGLEFCARIDTTAHASRHDLLLTAFESSLPVTIICNATADITDAAIGIRSTTYPSLDCTGTPLTGSKTGQIVDIIDRDQWANVKYVLQDSSGAQYCADYGASGLANRRDLLKMALVNRLPIYVSVNSASYITAVSVGSQSVTTPSPSCANTMLSTLTRTGVITQIINRDDWGYINYVLHANDGLDYCCQTPASESDKISTMMMALRTGQSVVITGDASHVVTQLAVGAAPSLSCVQNVLNGTASGVIVGKIHRDDLSTVNYVLQLPGGVQYCAQVPPATDPTQNRDVLLMPSLEFGLPVTLIANNGVVSGVSLGASTVASPPLSCGNAQLLDTRTGTIPYILNMNGYVAIGYALRTADGTEYCSEFYAADYTDGFRLFFAALKSDFGVTQNGTGYPSHYVLNYAVGY